MAKTTLFLDLDGVIQEPKTYTLYHDSLFLIQQFLKSYAVDVIISSNWRLLKDKKYFEILFDYPILDMNPVVQDSPTIVHPKYNECLMSIKKWDIESYLIIDDEPDQFPDNCSNLIITESATGFTDFHFVMAARFLT
jgi:hypothetical protein